MGIGDQFTELDMKNLIGEPLAASADASLQLAQSTAGFVNNVGFDEDRKMYVVDFSYSQKAHNADGTDGIQEMNLQAPLLAIVPIPNLQIDAVNVSLDMKVCESTQSESSKDMGASLSGNGGIFDFKVSTNGSVSSHGSNMRSTDNSAKYHVDVMAANHGTQEGLSRILDIIAANAAPDLASSKDADKNG
jgi:hypothetical protein